MLNSFHVSLACLVKISRCLLYWFQLVLSPINMQLFAMNPLVTACIAYSVLASCSEQRRWSKQQFDQRSIGTTLRGCYLSSSFQLPLR